MRKLCAGCKKWTVSFDFDGRFGYNGMRSDVAARGRVLPHSADAEIVHFYDMHGRLLHCEYHTVGRADT